MNSLDSVLDETEYRGEGVRVTQHGVFYQLKLLLLFLYRTSIADVSKFRFATELPDAEKFDDLILQYQMNDGDRMRLRMFQAKHHEPADGNSLPLITESDVLSSKDKDPYSLQKYFRSFWKIRGKCFGSENIYSILTGSEIEDFSIITNTDINRKMLGEQGFFKEIPFEDDFLLKQTDSKLCKIYKVNCDDMNREPIRKLCSIFENFSEYNILITKLAECIGGNGSFTRDTILDEYFYPLVDQVFECKFRDKSINFRPSFFTQTCDLDLQIFREDLIQITTEKHQLSEIAIKHKQVKCSGEVTNRFMMEKNCDLEKVEELVKVVVILLGDGSNPQIIVKDDEFSKVLIGNIRKLSGFVLALQHNKIKFTSQFLQSTTLPGNLDEFRRILKSSIGETNFSNLIKYEWIFPKHFKFAEEEAIFRRLPKKYIVTEHMDVVMEFFDQFKLIANYPNRFDLNKLLETGIKQKMKKLDGKAFQYLYQERLYTWMTERLGTFYTREKIRAVFKDININLSNWTMEGVTKSYMSEVSESYKFAPFPNLISFLDGHHQIWYFSNKNLQYGRLKVVQCFRDIQKSDHETISLRYTADFGHIFVKLTQLSNYSFCSEVLQCFRSDKLFDLLVIECDSHSPIVIFENLKEILDDFDGKKLILITMLDSSFSNQFKKGVFITEAYQAGALKDFTEKGQQKILETVINFQGSPCKLGKILADDETKSLLDDSIVTNIINKQPVSIGKKIVRSNGYDPDYYIDRTFKRKFEIENSNGLIDSVQVELDLLSNDSRIVIISDNAGMGKTTLFSSMICQLKSKHPDLWILRIDINNYYKALKQQSLELRENSVVDPRQFFIDYNLVDESDSFEFKLLSRYQEKTILFLDGFDEISPGYKDVVLEFLKSVIRNLNLMKIFVSTRPNLRRDLEGSLGEFSYSLQKFNNTDQENYLTKYWTKVWGCTVEIDKIREKSKHILRSVASSINDCRLEFTGVPLQIRMLAEIFGDRQRTNYDIPDIGSLYQKFVEQKYHKFYVCHKVQPGTYSAEVMGQYEYEYYLESHQIAAISTIFNKDIVDILLSTDHRKILEKFKKSIDENKEKYGIITQLIDGIPIFIHQTFAEYFAAMFLYENVIKNSNASRSAFEFLIFGIFNQQQYRVIRSFLNWQFCENFIDGLSVNADRVAVVTKYHRINPGEFINLCYEKFDKLVYYVIKIIQNDSEFFESFIINNETLILNMVAKFNSVKLVKLFIESGFDVYKVIQTVSKQNILHIAGGYNQLKVVRYLINDIGMDVTATDFYGMTVLHLASAYGHFDVVQLILENRENRKLIYAKDVRGLNAIDHAACNEHQDIINLLL